MQALASTGQTNRHSYFIKRSHRSFRSAQDILQEHAVLQHLASKNIPVATLISLELRTNRFRNGRLDL